MTATVRYTGDLRTACTHQLSASLLETDAPLDNHGKGERFSPTDLLATSLAACMLTVMGIKARGMDIDLQGVEVGVEKLMLGEPRRVGGINLTVHIPENLAALEMKTQVILQHTAETCPVMRSIHPDITITTNWGRWSR